MLERWTADRVLALAPDAASQKAGSRLAAPGPWTGLGAGEMPPQDREDEGGTTAKSGVWGLCKGSGDQAYRTAVDLDGPAWSCTCPSRKLPCKHALGLLLLWSAGSVPEDPAAVPDWAEAWLTGRQDQAQPRPERRPAGPADPAAARRRAEQRAARVADGVDTLGRWLADQVRHGMAGADRAGYPPFETMAAKMVDAQAKGLADRLRTAGTRPGSGDGWPERLLEDYAVLWLMLRAHDRMDRLDGPLAAALRTRIGWHVDSAELLQRAADQGTAVRDHWTVLGSRDSDEDKLTVREIWLRGEQSGRTALVRAIGSPGQAPALALPVGERLEADLVFHDAAAPLRAHLAERHGPPEPAGEPAGCDAESAALAYAEALHGEPWLDTWPVVLADVVAVPDALGWRIVGIGGGSGSEGPGGFWLPVDRSRAREDALWRLAAMSGGAGMTVFGEYGARGFAPVTGWHEGRAIPL
ncbi:SWIM zinc finger family protein [Yinghuangia soli]|uniref:SWIM zinc finger domain-containing protein n=1 Tax=Yinghuangia soli TaxID=2908204 RepID=A0AA41Q1X1_9ACTN|nr:SWIM zinc finger family protein [Yinghuangia soli]MCF2530050.1 SWIM zinc finger domain-containing protein [Yinghuangia soli]